MRLGKMRGRELRGVGIILLLLGGRRADGVGVLLNSLGCQAVIALW